MKRAALLTLSVLVASPAWAQDSDNDQVNDQLDAFPCDSAVTGISYAPAQGQHSLLLFEDQWPTDGDLDFNDVVLSTNFAFKTDAAGKVVALRATYNLVAAGGIFHNGFGLTLPVARSAVASVTRTVGAGSPQALNLELDAEATVLLSSNARELISSQEAFSHAQVNSDPQAATKSATPLVVDIVFSTPVTLNVGLAPFDTFIFRSDRPGLQVHLPAYAGTTAMETALFNTADDTSSPGRHFTGSNGIPFALLLPMSAAYPKEGVSISTLYPRIVNFAQSGGAADQDFMSSQVVASAAFSGAPAPAFVGADTFAVDTTCVPAPTCSDGYLNQGETGIDCGGPCSPCVTVASTCPTNTSVALPTTCQELQAAGQPSGTYCVDPDGNGGRGPLVVYCDQTTDGGGWTAVTNVTTTSPSFLSTTDTRGGTDYIVPIEYMQALRNGASEVRFHCENGSGGKLDLKTSDAGWMARPVTYGDGCGIGYYYRAPNQDRLSALPGHNVAINGAPYSGGCCCRPNFPVGVMTAGFGQAVWFMYDPYYSRAWPRCGGTTATFMRIYYR